VTLIIALATLSSFALTPIASRLARAVGAVDHPGERRVHTFATPRFGGPAIFGAILIASMASTQWRGFRALFLGAFIAMMVGALDDIHPQKPLTKLLVEVIAAVIVISGGWSGAGLGSFLMSVAFIVVTTNAINLVDGLDGLAAGLALMIALTLVLLSHGGSHAVMLLAVCGALLGFLPYNVHPARIFLGDSGALLVGFLLGTGAISDMHSVGAIAPAIALGFPLLEVMMTIARRFVRASPLFRADRDHIHHRVLGLGLDPRATVGLLYGCGAAFCAVALILPRLDDILKVPLLASLSLGIVGGVRMLGYHREMTALAPPLRINASEP